MQLTGETNNLDLYSEARYWCGITDYTDVTTYLFADFVRHANIGVDEIIALILNAGNWQFDDANQSGELLDVTTNLVSGTKEYLIGVTWLRIGRIRIKDSVGNWVTLIPIDRRQLPDTLLRQSDGDPKRYDKLGNYMKIYPGPNYSSSGGLEVQFQRGGHLFTTGDTTAVPGFASPFHPIIAWIGALSHCSSNGLERRAATLREMIGSPPDLKSGQPGSGMKKQIVDFYTSRDADQKIGLRTAREDYGQMGLESNAQFNAGRHPDRF